MNTLAEACDDGNDVDTDDCLPNCQAPRCGDGVVQAGIEACDDGNESDTDACLGSCQPARCGDGIVQAGIEACDDGNVSADDYCAADCTEVTGRCGDGVVQVGIEACDDGNVSADDYCAADCTEVTGRCGDGVVQAGIEACDDGNVSADDYCAADCTEVTGRCGDGVVQAGIEACDDGNVSADDYCAADCTEVTGRCGDGVVQADIEACDDENVSADDYCAADCTEVTGRCGDGVVQASVETCDDGNNVGNDYCAADCTEVTGNCAPLLPGEPSLVLGCRDDAPELSLCLSFSNDQPGTAYDGSASQLTGTVHGLDETLDGTGGRRVRRFDGSTYLDFGDGAAIDDFSSLTMETWLYLDAYPATRYTLLDDHLEFGLFVRDDGSVRCAFAASSTPGADFVAGQVPVGEWVHLACRVTPTKLTIFLNGETVGTLSRDISGRDGLVEPLLIGANSPQADDRLVGYLTDLRLWRGARSDGALCQSALR